MPDRPKNPLLQFSPLLLLLLTFLEYRVLHLLHDDHIQYLLGVSKGVATGKSEWRCWQNRLLGPWCVEAVQRLSGSTYEASYRCTTFGLLFLGNVLVYVFFLKLLKNVRISLSYAAIISGLFLALQDRSRLYIWDYGEIPLLAAFSYGMLAKKGIRFHLPLFLIWLLNRESALFVPVWLCIDSLGYGIADPHAPQTRRALSFNIAKCATGISLLGVGVAYTKLVRDAFFIRGEADLVHATYGNHFYLPLNLRALAESFSPPYLSGNVNILLVLIVSYLFYCFFRYSRWVTGERAKVMLMLLLQISAIFAFGIITEMRVWLPLIPLLAMCDAAHRFVDTDRPRTPESPSMDGVGRGNQDTQGEGAPGA